MKKQTKQSSRPRQVSNSCPQTPLLQQPVIETDPLLAQQIHDYLSKLPPGLRFVPSDAELILDYLKPKIEKKPLPICLIHPVNLYSSHPRTLAETHLKHPDVEETYYFSPRDRKYKKGTRPNRGVAANNHTFGYWKATGSDGQINIGEELIGYTNTLVFYEGKPSDGKKTNWIMHEYRVCDSKKRTPDGNMKLDDWVLCRVREKVETVSAKNKKNKDANMNTNTNEGDTNTENANNVDALTNEENTFVHENKCSTSQNDFTQSHQDMGLPWPQNSHYPLNTSQGMINDMYGSGRHYEELSPVPSTSYSNTFGVKHYEDCEYELMCWDNVLMCNNGFNFVPECVDQNSSWGLNVDGFDNFQVQERTNDEA